MSTKCTKCDINWNDKTLESNCPQLGWIDENIPVCPNCYSGIYLKECSNTDTFSFQMFTGKITNDKTGLVRERPPTAMELKIIEKYQAARLIPKIADEYYDSRYRYSQYMT